MWPTKTKNVVVIVILNPLMFNDNGPKVINGDVYYKHEQKKLVQNVIGKYQVSRTNKESG